MKKKINENMKSIIIVLSILILILIIGALVLIGKSNKNGYANIIESEVVEFPGTKVISNDNLKKEHCLNDICVSDVNIYKVDNKGRLECKVENKSEQTRSGYLKLKFQETSFTIAYRDLKPGIFEKSIAQFTNKKITDTTDYVLEELTKEEEKSIIK